MEIFPKVSIDILVVRNKKVLLGLLSEKWLLEGEKVYGVPGRDVFFRETIGKAVGRDIKQQINCEVASYRVICVNSNYEFGNHYIGIGVVADIRGEVELLKPEDWEKWEWFDLRAIPQSLFPAAKNLVKCYLTKNVNVSE